jgi:hypothetical protein
MIVFSAMVWHATYLVIYKQDEALADRCDLYAMLVFGVVVFIIHIVQTIWFVIAIQKRIDLEKLDKKAALSYLKTRMSLSSNGANNKEVFSSSSLPIVSDHQMSMSNYNINNSNTTPRKHSNKADVAMTNDTSFNQQQTQASAAASSKLNNVKSKRMLYSLSKMEDNSIITVHNSEDYTSHHTRPAPPPDNNNNNNDNNNNNYEAEQTMLIGLPLVVPIAGGDPSSKMTRNENTKQSHNRNHTPTSHNSHGNSNSNYNNNNNINSSNLLLISKSNSFTNAQNISLANQNNREYSNTNTNSLHHNKSSNSQQQHQQQQHHAGCHKVKNKNNQQHFYDVNRLNGAGNASHSLDYQYLPLIHQSSRDS